jgi:beta-galactosidase
MTQHPPIANGFPHLLHGGDYNPEQWPPEVWDEDLRLLHVARCNVVSIGIFSWAKLEPAEGTFDFGWMDRIIEKLTTGGIRFVLATPGGAKPAWMAQRYPETLRVTEDRRRLLWGDRHNHCFTSPVFREKCRIINTKLAERYGSHPHLAMWHVNNEYGGECHCDLCQAAFRRWLRARYHDDLHALNRAWWSTFWSHTITDWEQVDSPSTLGEMQVHGHTLDWKRFVTDQTIDCFAAEAAPLRQLAPRVPITTNLMGEYAGLDYYRLARACDVVSWDAYPSFHDRDADLLAGPEFSFNHDQRRAMLGKPFILMESAPAQQNYKPVCKLKRPGMHRLEGLQAIAHGSDSVMYFQWRKSRGGVEKFHGAVVDHHGGEHTRVFQDVAELGTILAKLDGVVGTMPEPEVAVIYDYHNRWALEGAAGLRNPAKGYRATCLEQHRALWGLGTTVDVIDSVDDFARYKLLVAPMLYMIRPGVAERVEAFVAGGGTLVTTYVTGVVDESDLCSLDGFPGPLRKVCGVWAEETDALYDDESADVVASAGNALGLTGTYAGRQLCDLIHAEGADVLATYGSQFYAGRPAVTVNRFGKGQAYYVASRNDDRFHRDLYGGLARQLGLRTAVAGPLPPGVTAQVRSDGTRDYVFVFSFARQPHDVPLGAAAHADALTGEPVGSTIRLPAYGSRVLVRERGDST